MTREYTLITSVPTASPMPEMKESVMPPVTLSCSWIRMTSPDDALTEAHTWSVFENGYYEFRIYEYRQQRQRSRRRRQQCLFFKYSILIPSQILVKSALRFARFGKEAESFGFDHTTIWTCWAKFFRRDFLLENKILFPEELILSEDTFFMVHAYLKADTILSYPKKIYRYRVNESSVSRNMQPKHLENNSHLRKKIYTLLRDTDGDRIYRDELAAFLIRKFIEEILYIKESGSYKIEDAVDYIRKSLERIWKNALGNVWLYRYRSGEKRIL